MRHCTAVLLAGVILALTACSADSPTPVTPDAAPLATAAAANGVRDEHIVVLKAGGSPRAAAAAVGATPRYVYQSALNGFAARLNPAQVAALRHNPHVDYIEPDGLVKASSIQSNPTWGLDRIDQLSRPLSSSYTYKQTGAGVNLYVIDTGIRTTHAEFGGRAAAGFDAFGGNAGDCNGHGTHVAATAGGSVYGVAKQVSLISVRVLDCNGDGTLGGVIAGVDWVTANHVGPAVANMSLGGLANAALDQAVQNSIGAGVTYVVAAGKDNADACGYSPARVGAALTVSNSTSSDARDPLANYGACVDIFAPGTSITSAWIGSDTDTNTISGTSMAAPHAAGVAAMYLEQDPGAAPAVVTGAINANATSGRLSGIGSGSPNRLLYSRFIPHPNPLGVSLACDRQFGWCDATASGGSGGYSFSWIGAAHQIDNGNTSRAFIQSCDWSRSITISAWVTDSDGDGAMAYSTFPCEDTAVDQ